MEKIENLQDLSKDELIKLVESLYDKVDTLLFEKYELNLQINELIKKYSNKDELYKKRTAQIFYKKSEVLKDEEKAINEAEATISKKKRGRKTASQNFIEDLKPLVSKTIIKDFDFEKYGIDRDSVKKFGEDKSYKLEYIPPKFEVVEIIRPKYKDKNKIYEAISDDPFPHSPLTSSLASNIVTTKYELGVPLYRYSTYLKDEGYNISTQNLSNWVIRTADYIKPVYERLLADLVNNKAHIIHADETTLEVIDYKDRDKDYVYLYATSLYDSPIYIYSFNGSRSIDKTKELLKDYKGYIICDGYSGYDSLKSDDIKLQRCMVHAKRYFNDCLKILPKDKREKSIAFKVCKAMNKLFKKEKGFKDKKLSQNEIVSLRNSKEYTDIIKEIDDTINSIEASEGSLLYKAKNYYLNQKDELYTYLEYGYLEMHNNLAERAIKPFVVGRKNWLFSKNEVGASSTSLLYSIVNTAKANGLNSEAYLKYIIDNLNKLDIDDLLPYSENLPDYLRITI